MATETKAKAVKQPTRKQQFIHALAEYLVGDQVRMSIRLPGGIERRENMGTAAWHHAVIRLSIGRGSGRKTNGVSNMSSTPITNPEPHEFAPITDSAFAGTTFAVRCCKRIGSGASICGQPRNAAIHRTSSGMEAERQPWIHGHEFNPMANALVCEKCGNFGYAHSRHPTPASPATPVVEGTGVVAEIVEAAQAIELGHPADRATGEAPPETADSYYSEYMNALHENDRLCAAHEREVTRLAKDAGEFAEKCYVEQSRLAAEVARLREALRRTAGHYHVAQKHGDGLVIEPFRDCENSVCAAARTALGDMK